MSATGGAFVTGIGVVSPAGLGLAPLYEACARGETLIAPDKAFGVPLGRVPNAALDQARQDLASSDYAEAFLDERPGTEAEKPMLLTGSALLQAIGPSGVGMFDKDTGLIYATTTGHIASWEKDLPKYVRGDLNAGAFAETFRDYPLTRALHGFLKRTDFRGPFQVLTSACAAGAQALVLAELWLRTGRAKRVVVGATETLTNLTIKGFGCFSLLAPDVARPFGLGRLGINLAEASTFMVLTADPKGPHLGVVHGGATTLDSFDMTRPHPEGRGIHQAITQALAQSRTEAQAIDWVHAHGTGTPANDLSEATALRMLFGQNGPLVTSTKATHGHTLGASGLLEAGVVFEALRRGELLPTATTGELDPALGIRVATRCEKRPLARVLKTTLGFGGVNAALVLGKGHA